MQAFESTPEMESAGTPYNPPIEVGKSQDWHLAGLLTRASMKLNDLPGKTSQWLSSSLPFSSLRLQLRGSGGLSPRFPNTRYSIYSGTKYSCQSSGNDGSGSVRVPSAFPIGQLTNNCMGSEWAVIGRRRPKFAVRMKFRVDERDLTCNGRSFQTDSSLCVRISGPCLIRDEEKEGMLQLIDLLHTACRLVTGAIRGWH
jgi:hypothetical protein